MTLLRRLQNPFYHFCPSSVSGVQAGTLQIHQFKPILEGNIYYLNNFLLSVAGMLETSAVQLRARCKHRYNHSHLPVI